MAKSSKSLKATYNFVRGQDYFGHPVRFHFNNRGPDHKTFSGGLVSILVRLFIVAYFVVLVKRLVLFEGDQNSMSTFRTEFDVLGEVSFTNTTLSLFGMMYDINYLPIKYDENAKRHLRIEWVQVSQNFLVLPMQVNQTRYEAVPCNLSNTADGFEIIMETNQGAPFMLCPPNLKDLSMMNSSEAGISKVVQLQVNKCKNDTVNPQCATPKEIDEFAEKIIFYSGGQSEKIDFTKRGSGVKPVYKKFVNIQGKKLQRGVMNYLTTALMNNQIETYDSLLSIGFPSDEYEFFDIMETRVITSEMNVFFPTSYYVQTFSISEEYKLHERHIYNLLDLLGDLGGVFEVIIGAIGIFVLPFSEASFLLKALQKLYLAKTDDETLFLKPKSSEAAGGLSSLNSSLQQSTQKSVDNSGRRASQRILSFKALVPEVLKGTKLVDDSKSHYPVIINNSSRNRIIFGHYFLSRWCFRKNQNPGLVVTPNDRYDLLYKKGRKLLHEDLSIEKLIKTLRDIKIFMKEHWLDDRRRFEIQHNPRNIIDLDNLNDYLYAEEQSDSSLSVELEVCLGENKCAGAEEKYVDQSTDSVSSFSLGPISKSRDTSKFRPRPPNRRSATSSEQTLELTSAPNPSHRQAPFHQRTQQALMAIPEEHRTPPPEDDINAAWDNLVDRDPSLTASHKKSTFSSSGQGRPGQASSRDSFDQF